MPPTLRPRVARRAARASGRRAWRALPRDTGAGCGRRAAAVPARQPPARGATPREAFRSSSGRPSEMRAQRRDETVGVVGAQTEATSGGETDFNRVAPGDVVQHAARRDVNAPALDQGAGGAFGAGDVAERHALVPDSWTEPARQLAVVHFDAER